MTRVHQVRRGRAARTASGSLLLAAGALLCGVAAAISWRFGIWWVSAPAVFVAAAVAWSRHRAQTAWLPAAVAADAVGAVGRGRPATLHLSLAVAARGDAKALQRAHHEVPARTLDPHRQQAAATALDAAARQLYAHGKRNPDQFLNRLSHPVILILGPPALVLSGALAQSVVTDVVVLSGLAVVWVTLRERYQSVPKELARRAVDAALHELIDLADFRADPLVQLCTAARWTPSVLHRARRLVVLASPDPAVTVAEERLRDASAMATGGSR